MNNDKGFIFPLTLITITILFLVLTTLVLRYEKELIMTNNLQKQYLIESLFSLAVNKKEINFIKSTDLPPTKTYDFNQGQVTISYTAFHSHFGIQFLITLKDRTQYTIYQTYPWAKDADDEDTS